MTKTIKTGKKILPGLSTLPRSDWKSNVASIEKLGLEEIAIFPTFIEIEERKQLYSALEKTPLKKIPHVHLRDDMEPWELEYFIKRYQAEVFNIHPWPGFKRLFEKCPQYKKMTFVENLDTLSDDFFKMLEDGYGGICLDASHYEDAGRLQGEPSYEKFEECLSDYPIGCCHISGVKDEMYEYSVTNPEGIVYKEKLYGSHYVDELSELNYVKKYLKYLPPIVSIELENSFEYQLKVKEYLEKMINE